MVTQHIGSHSPSHLWRFILVEDSKTSNIEYHFINEINTSYAVLQNNYKGDYIIDILENLVWRADIKLLFELCHYYHYFKLSLLIIFTLLFRKRRFMSDIKWFKLPLIHSARWNSRAVYCLIANFLMPNWQQRLATNANFIRFEWITAWFSD